MSKTISNISVGSPTLSVNNSNNLLYNWSNDSNENIYYNLGSVIIGKNYLNSTSYSLDVSGILNCTKLYVNDLPLDINSVLTASSLILNNVQLIPSWSNPLNNTIFYNGKIGINTSTPSNELTVVGNGSFTGTISCSTPSTSTNSNVVATTAYVQNNLATITPSQWTTNSSNISYNSGSVGIGTNAPSSTLTVIGNGSFSGTISCSTPSTSTNSYVVATTAYVKNNIANLATNNPTTSYTSTSIGVSASTGGTATIAIGNNALIYGTTVSGCVAVGNYTLNSAGNYLNTTAIGYNAGRADIGGSLNTYIGYNANSNGTASYVQSTAIGANSTISANNQIVLGTSTETVIIPGKIGVQTTSPAYPLDVNGAIRCSSINYNNAPMFSVYGATATISTFGTVFLINPTIEYNIGNCYNASTGNFTPNVAGYYSVVGSSFSNFSTTSTGRISLFAVKNGIVSGTNLRVLASTFVYPTTNASVQVSGSCIVYLNGSTDYLSLCIYNGSSTSYTCSGLSYFDYFQATYLRSG